MATTALVVEGGGMRGIFAAGVLDAFLAETFKPFDFVVGVSAGSTTSVSYLAGDHGRSRKIITGHACQRDFINYWRFLSGGHLADVRWLIHQSHNDVPLSVDRYTGQDTPLFVVTTAIDSGEACYFQADADNMLDLFTASCALPLIFKEYPKVNGDAMTDGGVGDAIPVQWAYQQGARDITVILSRPRGFRKPPSRLSPVLRRLMQDTPALYNAMITRDARYNAAMDFIDHPPADCRINVIAPGPDFPVSRLTTHGQRLELGYRQGVLAGSGALQGAFSVA